MQIPAIAIAGLLVALLVSLPCGAEEVRVYANTLTRIENPKPILADHPEYVSPIVEEAHYEAPAIVQDENADLNVRAWRFSYNARGIIEMPNHLCGAQTAIVVVHPWGIDDSNGWKTPQPAGVADFCTPIKNHLAHGHVEKILNPFLLAMRDKVGMVLYSQPGKEDPIRKMLYRSVHGRPTEAEHAQGKIELHAKLNSFDYTGEPIVPELKLNANTPVIDYFKQFPGLDSGPRYNREGFWQLPIPIIDAIKYHPDDVMIYDAEGYEVMRDFLKLNGIRHILLTGYCTDMCYKSTTAGYENLSKDFNVFLVGDATLATFPANTTPAFATNASLSFAALNQLVTQISWIEPAGKE
ncbi:MAG: hypothetical protein AMXMBFR84_24820 [Candidatus Hydrogenedentota bacterium]